MSKVNKALIVLILAMCMGMIIFAIKNLAYSQDIETLEIDPKIHITMREYDNPCEKPNEIEHQVDWGPPGCRHFQFIGVTIFGKQRDVEIGFHSDGTMIWRVSEKN